MFEEGAHWDLQISRNPDSLTFLSRPPLALPKTEHTAESSDLSSASLPVWRPWEAREAQVFSVLGPGHCSALPFLRKAGGGG